MTAHWSTNNTGVTGAAAMYLLKTVLLAAGWVVMGSSDGSSFSNAGVDHWTSGAAVANTGAWVRLRMPTANGVQRELLIQRGSLNQVWRVIYSYTSGFTGSGNGAISATVAPTAADEVAVYGTVGGGTSTLLPSDGTYNWSCHATDVAPFVFYGVAIDATPGGSGLFMDALAAGSYDSGDADPFVFSAASAGSLLAGNYITYDQYTAPGYPFSWCKKGLPGEGWVQTGLWQWASGVSSIGSAGTGGVDPTTGKDVGLPAYWGRTTLNPAPNGVRGASTLFKWAMTARGVKDTLSVSGASSRELLYVDKILIPWDGSVPA